MIAEAHYCPTCRHAHPGGFGIGICACGDCFTLFGPVSYEHMAPDYQKRYRELLEEANGE